MEVTRHEGKPVTPPPPTYDLTGLTQDEAWFLHDLLGKLISYDDTGVDHHAMYEAMYAKLGNRSTAKRFTFTADDARLARSSYLTIRAAVA